MPRKTICLGLSLAVLMFAANRVPASDWNQWRGPNRNGIAPDSPKLADEWGKKGPDLLWNSEPIPVAGDGGFSSFAVVKGKVYLFVNWKRYQGQGGAADVVVCLDANTGATLWQTSFPGREFGWGSSSTPCVSDGKVVAVGGNGMYCLDAESGREIWKVASIGNELSSSPTIVDGVIVVSTGILKGFDLATGNELWACPDAGSGNGNNTSPSVWKFGGRQYVITNMGRLTCVDPRDGRVVWQGERADCNSTPAIAGDYCIVGSQVAAYKLSADKAEKVFGTGLGDRGASQILYDNHVFAFTGGALRCLDLTGQQLWEQGFGGEISSPVLADGKLYAICGDDKLVMVGATVERPSRFHEARIPVQGCSSPAVWDGKLFVRLKSGVACYDLTKIPADSISAPPRDPDSPGNVAPGLTVAYYVGGDLNSALYLNHAVPVKTGTATAIDLTFAEATENFGLKFTGYVDVPKDGEYRFYTTSDDGSKLFIGNTEVVNNDGAHAAREEWGAIRLKAGKHALSVYFAQMSGGYELSVAYEGPDIPKSAIPAEAMFHDVTP